MGPRNDGSYMEVFAFLRWSLAQVWPYIDCISSLRSYWLTRGINLKVAFTHPTLLWFQHFIYVFPFLFDKANPVNIELFKTSSIPKIHHERQSGNILEIIPEQPGPIFLSGFSPCRRWCPARCRPPPPFRKSPSFLSTFITYCQI